MSRFIRSPSRAPRQVERPREARLEPSGAGRPAPAMPAVGFSLADIALRPPPPADPMGDAPPPTPEVVPEVVQRRAEGPATDADGWNGRATNRRPANPYIVAPRPNHTGLPDRLKANIEAMSALSLDDVRVHYNSPKPVQLRALAYARGTDIHLGPGQEHHLPHEAWHVVQQKQGRVRPTSRMGNVAINDDGGLEREAEGLGERGRNDTYATSSAKRPLRTPDAPRASGRALPPQSPVQCVRKIRLPEKARPVSSSKGEKTTSSLEDPRTVSTSAETKSTSSSEEEKTSFSPDEEHRVKPSAEERTTSSPEEGQKINAYEEPKKISPSQEEQASIPPEEQPITKLDTETYDKIKIMFIGSPQTQFDFALDGWKYILDESDITTLKSDRRALYWRIQNGAIDIAPKAPKEPLKIRAGATGDMYHLRGSFVIRMKKANSRKSAKAQEEGKPNVLILGVNKFNFGKAKMIAGAIGDEARTFYTNDQIEDANETRFTSEIVHDLKGYQSSRVERALAFLSAPQENEIETSRSNKESDGYGPYEKLAEKHRAVLSVFQEFLKHKEMILTKEGHLHRANTPSNRPPAQDERNANMNALIDEFLSGLSGSAKPTRPKHTRGKKRSEGEGSSDSFDFDRASERERLSESLAEFLRGLSIQAFADLYAPDVSAEKQTEFANDLRDKGHFSPGATKYVVINFRNAGHSGAGNAPALDTGQQGFDEIIALVQKKLPKTQIVPMGELSPPHYQGPNLIKYWLWDSVKSNRLDQISILKFLTQNYNIVGAVGMRSGVMDQWAFLGVPIISIDIGPHHNLEKQDMPRLAPSKGWDRGLQLENAYGKNYGRVFLSIARGDEMPEKERKAGSSSTSHYTTGEQGNDNLWKGAFGEENLQRIESAITFYLGEDQKDAQASGGFRHGSHPLVRGEMKKAFRLLYARLRDMRGRESLTPYDLHDGLLHYLRNLFDLEADNSEKNQILDSSDLETLRALESEVTSLISEKENRANPDLAALRQNLEDEIATVDKKIKSVEDEVGRLTTHLTGLTPKTAEHKKADGELSKKTKELKKIRNNNSAPDIVKLRGLVDKLRKKVGVGAISQTIQDPSKAELIMGDYFLERWEGLKETYAAFDENDDIRMKRILELIHKLGS